MPIKDPEARRAYHRKYMSEIWYPKNRKAQQELSRANRDKMLKKIADIKVAAGCIDCGYNESPFALDFDHTSDDKLFGISTGVMLGYSWQRIETEIKKCEIVCANCHRIRTAKRIMREGGQVSSPVS